ELALVEPHVARFLVDVERQDHALEGRIGAVRERGGVFERGDRDPGLGFRGAAAGWKRGHQGHITSTRKRQCDAYYTLYHRPASGPEQSWLIAPCEPGTSGRGGAAHACPGGLDHRQEQDHE